MRVLHSGGGSAGGQAGKYKQTNDKILFGRAMTGQWAHLYNLTSIKAEKITALVLMV